MLDANIQTRVEVQWVEKLREKKMKRKMRRKNPKRKRKRRK